MKAKVRPSDNPEPQVIDGATGTFLPTAPGSFGKDGRRIDLSKLRDVRIEMAKVYRMHDSGDISDSNMTKRIYSLKSIGDIIAIAEFEERLAALEAFRPALEAAR